MGTHENEACCTRCAPKPVQVNTHKEEHHHHHDHEHGPIPEGFFTTPHFIAFVIGSLFFGTALFLNDEHFLTLWVYIVAYILIGGEILLMALKNIVKGEVFDENFLMSLATIGAFSIGEYPEGVAVMFFYRIGEFFQDLAVARSRHSIESLMDIRPDFANVLSGTQEARLSPNEVEIGSLILVRPGEKIPLDGVILHGQSTLDTSALTGESLPKEVDVGEAVLSGTINKTGVLTIQTTKSFAESTVSKILDLVQHASAKKAKTEQFITTFARY
jgi:Cd2+/Zn2+-exporting ATPase